MPEISVIMPSLNVAGYIRTCMESVMNQSFTDLEIIAVDAGSTDGTWEILREYAAKDSRIRCVRSDKKSYGYQLNLGLELAGGKYIGVVETDDFIERDMYETLYKSMAVDTRAMPSVKNPLEGNEPDTQCPGGYDYVKGVARAFWEISNDVQVAYEIRDARNAGGVLNPSGHPALFSADAYLWLGLYKASFIKQIRLNETPGAAYQDIGFNFQVFQRSKKALYLDKVVYHYRQDNRKASGYDVKAFRYLLDEYGRILEMGVPAEWIHAICQRMAEQCLGRFHNMAAGGRYWKESAEEIEELRRWLMDAKEQGMLTEESLSEYDRALLKLWWKGSEVLYMRCKERYGEKIQAVRTCFQAAGNHEIVIFGAGKYGTFFHALSENRYPGKVAAYCDNGTNLQGKTLQGVTVYEPAQAVERFHGAVFVVTMVRDKENARKQLLQLGVPDERIVEFVPVQDYLLFNMDY